MKPVYILIFLLSLGAVILLFYLIPTREEKSLLESKSGKVEEAKKFYEQEFEKGILNPDVVMPLKNIKIKEGDIESAIHIMQKYVEANPLDEKALLILADLYKTNQQIEDFYKTIEKVENLKKNGEMLQELSGYYRNQPDKLLELLQTLVKTKYADESNFLQLAQLLARNKEYKEAALVLEEKRKRFPKKVGINDIFFEIWALMHLAKQENNKELEKEAVLLLKNYLLQKNKFADTYYALNTFKQRYFELTPFFIQEISPLIEKNSYLETVAMQALLEFPEEKAKALSRLEQINENEPNRLSQNVLFDIYLEKEDDARLLRLLESSPPRNIESRKLLEFAQRLIIEEKPELALKMRAILGSELLQNRPVLDLALQIAAHLPGTEKRLEEFLNKGYLSQSEALSLFKIAAYAKYEDLALRFGERISYKTLTEYELISTASLYIQFKRQDLFREILMKNFPEIARSRAEGAFALIELSSGRPEYAKNWIEARRKISKYILTDFYLVAAEQKEYSFALALADRMRKDFPSDLSDAYFAFALAQLGATDHGLEILRTLFCTCPSREIERLYYAALIDAAKKERTYREELLAYMEDKERKGPVTAALLREFAYHYLEILKNIPKAKAAFEILALQASTHNQDVETLIYLWGPRISCDKLQWLIQRARSAKGKDKGLWLQDLAYVGAYGAVISIFEETWQTKGLSCFDTKTLFAYLEALAFEKRHAPLRQAIACFIPLVSDVKDLIQLANYAAIAESLPARLLIWKKITTCEPQRLQGWQELAKAHFDGRDYPKALDALRTYFALACEKTNPDSGLAEALYEKGESYYGLRCYECAWKCYCASLQKMLSACDKTPLMLALISLIDYRLSERFFLDISKENKQAISLYWMHRYYQRTSGNQESLASLANLMMDVGNYLDAKKLLIGSRAY